MKNLSLQEQDMFWGETGPYSEAKMILNTRILDDGISRVTVEIDGNINPTTFKIVKKNKKVFAKDPVIIDLLESARYEGTDWGYHVSLGYEELRTDEDGEKVMDRARNKLQILKDAIIRMHEFVLDYLDED
ncbi:hypothetical protein A3A67_02985 [Candidatus Peribacteria bacterium RIFCSPLOWO2_01_FULL_51_18]|nr:MAG: hypothetical protein A3C52_00845 [Candidatus Peribacteria bacterium RIFCSPHIGHO2_02_FULL_51_15]OGJ66012.1 MAG: hypothetical protein A3A67_02985 [Candidatus Peribacteria bacterium RIFCSPLOWO2_01_FULL_51_18]OGJ69297.1 MAG: hypothetical protein A3J34_01925 [Candidatus Peribacteria bacterium RIFCSPLOWO2_02_FULL_51_10]